MVQDHQQCRDCPKAEPATRIAPVDNGFVTAHSGLLPRYTGLLICPHELEPNCIFIPDLHKSRTTILSRDPREVCRLPSQLDMSGPRRKTSGESFAHGYGDLAGPDV